MHTEHIRNLHPGWVVGGWLVALATSSLVFMVFVGLGLIGPGAGGGTVLAPVSVAIGFFTGGLLVGLRWADAPILHGVAITGLSVVLWFLSELAGPVLIRDPEGAFTRPSFVLGMVLLQGVAAVAGGAAGRHLLRSGESPDVS